MALLVRWLLNEVDNRANERENVEITTVSKWDLDEPKAMQFKRGHAFLLVVPTSQFSKEEKAAISSLQTLFGRRIYEYMIVVFAGSDEHDEENQSLEDFLRDSPDF
ncbi:hypothetical protein R6Q59_006575 [Mikania micrantha]